MLTGSSFSRFLSLQVALIPQLNTQNRVVHTGAAFQGVTGIASGVLMIHTWPGKHTFTAQAPQTTNEFYSSSFPQLHTVTELPTIDNAIGVIQWLESSSRTYCLLTITVKTTWCAVTTRICSLSEPFWVTISVPAESRNNMSITGDNASMPLVILHAI